MTSDGELLRQYAEQRDDAAFAELVRRHLDFVYSVALRQANGDVPLAQDATQTVFVDLARKARGLADRTTLTGWLHTSARYAAVNSIRSDSRRRAREHEATAMQQNSAPETNWAEIGPLLDEAVGSLREQDREAVLLRFFKNLSHQEVGAALGLGEDAARKRVDRALEKLREHFARRGVTASSALLSATIIENSVQAAPAGLAASMTSGVLAGTGGASAGAAFLTVLFRYFMTTKTKTVFATVLVLALAGTLAVKWHRSHEASVASGDSALRAVKPLSPMAASLPKPPPAQVAAPVVAPAPAGNAPGPAAPEVWNGNFTLGTTPTTPPNADLKTAIPSLAHYLATDDYVHVIPFVMTPAEVQQALDSGHAASLEDIASRIQTTLEDHTHGNITGLVQALNAIKDQTPVIDQTGATAVYQIDPQAPGDQLIFLKKNGLWYLW